ncbi:MAG: phosphoribosylamine--glycine ligase, partial [Myxococcales bacterium]|nr:phosphoribosylamine--glycine ligase [Myxococcales bacterium]
MAVTRRILVVGSGGREHALGRALARSPSAAEVIVAPGNPGCAETAEGHAVLRRAPLTSPTPAAIAAVAPA